MYVYEETGSAAGLIERGLYNGDAVIGWIDSSDFAVIVESQRESFKDSQPWRAVVASRLDSSFRRIEPPLMNSPLTYLYRREPRAVSSVSPSHR